MFIKGRIKELHYNKANKPSDKRDYCVTSSADHPYLDAFKDIYTVKATLQSTKAMINISGVVI